MGTGATKGGRDFLELGAWNLMCAYCGRKRKSHELLRDDEFARGLWCCPEHRDLRHPQDFARGIKEDMSVPFVQPPVIAFTSLPAGFPLSIVPQPVALVVNPAGIYLETESGIPLETEAGAIGDLITLEPGSVRIGYALAQFPSWVNPANFAWTWQSGGIGISITNPATLQAFFVANASGLSGVALLTMVNDLGQTATATVPVSS